jgi:HEAT repeat protein
VDLLGVIKDPRSIDVLDEMTWWEPDWDEFRALALKAALALSNINTPKAIEVLRGVAATADPRTRDFAQGALEFAQSPKGKAERRPDV